MSHREILVRAPAGRRVKLARRAVFTRRRGQSLVEFAVVALVLYLLIALILTFGHLFYVSYGVQQAADVAAREISRTALPADSLDLDDVLRANANDVPEVREVRERIFDDHYLVLNVDPNHANGFQGRTNLQDLVAALPVLNQQLVPIMISDQVDGITVLRYPGAIFRDTDAADDPADPPPSGFKVAIPLVVERNEDGVETIDWVPVVEAIQSPAEPDFFRISSRHRGLVALRINYPCQSATMSSFRANPDGPFEPTVGNPNVADDSMVSVVDGDGFAPNGTATESDREAGAYAGPYGLGRQYALGMTVRPFRRLVSAQAVYRREIFD
jgi:hypothetical protein